MSREVKESVIIKKEYSSGEVLYETLNGGIDMSYKRNVLGQFDGSFHMLDANGQYVFKTQYTNGVENGTRLEKLFNLDLLRESTIDHGIVKEDVFKENQHGMYRPISEDKLEELIQKDALKRASDSSSFDKKVVNDALDNVFLEHGIDRYSFSDELKDIFARHMMDRSDPEGFFEDLDHGKCSSGIIGELTLPDDTKNFYIRHMDDIEDYIETQESIRLESPRYNSAAWQIVEDMASIVSSDIKEAVQTAVTSRLNSKLMDETELKDLASKTKFVVVRDAVTEGLKRHTRIESSKTDPKQSLLVNGDLTTKKSPIVAKCENTLGKDWKKRFSNTSPQETPKKTNKNGLSQ